MPVAVDCVQGYVCIEISPLVDGNLCAMNKYAHLMHTQLKRLSLHIDMRWHLICHLRSLKWNYRSC